MKRRHLDTLKQINQLSNKDLRTKLLTDDITFIIFLCESIVNILGGVVRINATEFTKYESQIKLIVDPAINSPAKRKIFSSNQGLKLVRLIAPYLLKFFENALGRICANTKKDVYGRIACSESNTFE